MMDTKLDLRSFKIPLGKLSPMETFKTRQGTSLSYRLYSAWSDNLVILYHGVGGDSRYMCVLASALAAAGIATVVTPDFRGHGGSLGLSDQISPNQLEVDLEELLIHIKMQRSVSRILLAGHSLGGGFTLRVAVSDLRNQFYRFVALAPHLPVSLAAFHDGFGGWITPQDEGFHVNMPEIFISGQEKLTYSAEYLRAATAPENILDLLQKFQPPVQVITGAEDEVARASRHQELFSARGIPVEIIPGLNHLSLVAKPDRYLSFFE